VYLEKEELDKLYTLLLIYMTSMRFAETIIEPAVREEKFRVAYASFGIYEKYLSELFKKYEKEDPRLMFYALAAFEIMHQRLSFIKTEGIRIVKQPTTLQEGRC